MSRIQIRIQIKNKIKINKMMMIINVKNMSNRKISRSIIKNALISLRHLIPLSPRLWRKKIINNKFLFT